MRRENPRLLQTVSRNAQHLRSRLVGLNDHPFVVKADKTDGSSMVEFGVAVQKLLELLVFQTEIFTLDFKLNPVNFQLVDEAQDVRLAPIVCMQGRRSSEAFTVLFSSFSHFRCRFATRASITILLH